MEENRGMPKRGTYIALFIINFVLGVLWGLLSISGFTRMNNGLSTGNAEEAWAGANKIKTLFFIGLALNIVCIVVYVLVFAKNA